LDIFLSNTGDESGGRGDTGGIAVTVTMSKGQVTRSGDDRSHD